MTIRSVTVGRPHPMDENVELLLVDPEAAWFIWRVSSDYLVSHPSDTGVRDLVSALAFVEVSDDH